jgi:hypothetical protein
VEFWLPQRHAPADVGGLLAVVGHVERQAALSLGIVHVGKVLQFCREQRCLKAAERSHRMLSIVLSLIIQLYLAEQWATCGNRNRNAQTKLKGGEGGGEGGSVHGNNFLLRHMRVLLGRNYLPIFIHDSAGRVK